MPVSRAGASPATPPGDTAPAPFTLTLSTPHGVGFRAQQGRTLAHAPARVPHMDAAGSHGFGGHCSSPSTRQRPCDTQIIAGLLFIFILKSGAIRE